MNFQNTIFYRDEWRWSKFQKYIMLKLDEYNCEEYKLSSEYQYKESTYGSKRNSSDVCLLTYAANNERIKFCRSVCINSPSYSVLNFLIIPNNKYNIPFFGVDFVSLPTYHLIVLDFQPSINVSRQFDKNLLNKLISIKDQFHLKVPPANTMSAQISQFFSPGVIWSKLPKSQLSENLITRYLYPTFQKYLYVYLNLLFCAKEVHSRVQKDIFQGQIKYLNYRKRNDPARPMLRALFGELFTESLINNLLFKV